MGVYKRPKREWNNGKPIWYFHFKHEKRRYYEGRFSSRKEAQEAERKRIGEIRSKRNKPIRTEHITVADFMPLYLDHRSMGRTDLYRKREERRSRPIAHHFSNHRLRNLTVGDVHDYVAKRKQIDSLANRSINLELTLLRNMYRFAIEKHYAESNPPREVKNLPEVQDEKWIPVPEELESFVSEAGKTYSGAVMVPWISFMAYTGARPGESFMTQWKDIDFEKEQIRVFNSKHNGHINRRHRYVEMHSDLKLILLEWKEEWGRVFAERHERYPDETYPLHDYVFFNPRNQKVPAQTFRKCFYQARQKAGVPLLTPHTLRHYFISQCVMSGIDFFTISKWVGHKNTRMIEEVYGHLSPEYRREQMAKLRIGGNARRRG